MGLVLNFDQPNGDFKKQITSFIFQFRLVGATN